MPLHFLTASARWHFIPFVLPWSPSVALETATYVPELVSSNPGHTDGLTQTDSHLRLIKSVSSRTFPNFTSAALTSTQAALDAAVASVTGTGYTRFPLGTALLPGLTPVGDPDTGYYSTGANKLAAATNGVKAYEIDAAQNMALTAGLSVVGPITGPGAVPIGMPCAWLINTLPAAAFGTYAWMNGQAVSRTTYAAAFALLGTTYGVGDNSTTFNLPDWRETVPVGNSTMGGTSARGLLATVRATFASIFGEEKHTLDTTEIPSHTHTANVTDPGHSHIYQKSGNLNATGGASGSVNSNAAADVTNASTTGITVANTSTGGGLSHNNMQPSQVCNWIVRLA
jgi:microcystin-dependent protein